MLSNAGFSFWSFRENRIHSPMMAAAAAFFFFGGVAPLHAVLGNGWIPTSFTKKIHLDDDVDLQTFSWVPYKSVCSPTVCADYTYDSATDTETFRIFDSRSNRSEIRLQNDYSSGIWQFEGYVTFDAPLHDESLFQIFGNTGSAATFLMMRGYRDNGGEIRVMSGSNVIASGVYGQEVRINIIHKYNVSARFYVNGRFVYEKPHNDPGVTNYWKYGCYGTTSGNVPAIVKWRAVRTWRDGLPPEANPTPPGAYEAEDAVLSGAVVASNNAGYTGTGFVDYINPVGDYIEWTVTVPNAGLYDFKFRYALQSGNRPLEIRVNGQVVNAGMSFPATGSWTAWDCVTLPLQWLQAGSNTIRTTAIGFSGANVDHLLLAPLDAEKTALKARYIFDDGTAKDVSGNGNHGTLAGTAVIVNDSVRGKVLLLDGVGGKVESGNPASLNLTGPITVAAWVNSNTAGGGVNRNIINRGHGGSPTRELTLRLDSTANYDFGSYESGRGDRQATLAIPPGDVGTNTWVHLAGTWDGALWNLYRNGVLVHSFADPDGPLPMTVGWAIGARGGVSGFERVFNGLIDDVRIYNTALCSGQIQRIMNNNPVGDIDGDGLVNLTDFAFLSAQWLDDGALVPSADFWPGCSGNGAVDMHELMLMISHFLQGH